MRGTFRDAYCRQFECPLEEFEERVFWQTLHRRSYPLSMVAYYLHGDVFERDFQTIRQLGLAQTRREFLQEIESFRWDCRTYEGLLKSICRLRVSGRRLIRLFEQLSSDSEAKTSLSNKNLPL